MNKIKVISSLKLDENGLRCKDKLGKLKSILHLQGSMDGACATYSVLMNLLLLRTINHKDTEVYAVHKTKATKTLFEVFCNSYGMHRNGQSFIKIKKMLTESFHSEIECIRRDSENEKSVEHIKKVLSEDRPVIISIEAKNYAHALLAIGMEYEESDDKSIIPTKIFCLDPSGIDAGYNYWNSVIDLYPDKPGTKYKYLYLMGSCTERVALTDILVITKL